MSPNIKPILTENDPVSNAIQTLEDTYFTPSYSIAINILMLTPIIYMLQVYDRVILWKYEYTINADPFNDGVIGGIWGI